MNAASSYTTRACGQMKIRLKVCLFGTFMDETVLNIYKSDFFFLHLCPVVRARIKVYKYAKRNVHLKTGLKHLKQ